MVAGQQKQQPGDAAIAVAERMDAQEIQIQRGGERERRNPFLFHAALPQLDHLGHRLRGLFGGNGLEADAAAAIGVGLDDVHVLFLVMRRHPRFRRDRACGAF